jgi:hypothetical protein
MHIPANPHSHPKPSTFPPSTLKRPGDSTGHSSPALQQSKTLNPKSSNAQGLRWGLLQRPGPRSVLQVRRRRCRVRIPGPSLCLVFKHPRASPQKSLNCAVFCCPALPWRRSHGSLDRKRTKRSVVRLIAWNISRFSAFFRNLDLRFIIIIIIIIII